MSDSPPPHESGRPGPVSRLLELGNHNKLIAVATLLTVVTGASFVVNAVRTAFSEEDGYSEEILVQAIEYLQARAEAPQEPDRIGSSRGREAAEEALRTVGAEANGATPAERRKIASALRAFGSGDDSLALRMLSEIATAQELRGDLDAAAETWCERGHLRVMSAHAEALADFERADDVSISGIDSFSQRERARLLRYADRRDEAVHALRSAVAAAEDEGDDFAKCVALSDLGVMKGTSWDQEPAFQQERDEAGLELVALSRELRARPEYLDQPVFIAVVGNAAAVAGGGLEGLHRPNGRPVETPHSAEIAEDLRLDLTALPQAGTSGLSQINRDHAVFQFACALAYVLEAMGEPDAEVTRLFDDAIAAGRSVLDSPDYATWSYAGMDVGFRGAGYHFLRAGQPESAVDAFQAMRVGHLRMLDASNGSTQYQSMLIGTDLLLGEAEIAAGEVERGQARILETVESVRQMENPLSLWEFLHMVANALRDVDEDLARSHLEEADALAASGLNEDPRWPTLVAIAPEAWQETRLRLGFERAR